MKHNIILNIKFKIKTFCWNLLPKFKYFKINLKCLLHLNIFI